MTAIDGSTLMRKGEGGRKAAEKHFGFVYMFEPGFFLLLIGAAFAQLETELNYK